MPAVYNGLDWLVSASHSEGSPNVLGEAMACGVPGITTDTGDAAWLLAEGGGIGPETLGIDPIGNTQQLGGRKALFGSNRQAALGITHNQGGVAREGGF